MWPQCCSFADVSQWGVDFIKKIEIIFWFDFHRCSHGLSKIGHYSRKQSGSKIWFLNRKLTLKIRFRHFLMTHVNICENQIKKNILLIFLLKSSPWWLTSAKLHHWGHTSLFSMSMPTIFKYWIWPANFCISSWKEKKSNILLY